MEIASLGGGLANAIEAASAGAIAVETALGRGVEDKSEEKDNKEGTHFERFFNYIR